MLTRIPFIFLLGLLPLATLGCGESGDPVAAIALTVDRESVPLGAPIELSLRLDVAPGFTGLDEDYRVLVHFLDETGDFMWGEDHDPPVPASEWNAGQTISYTRQAMVPMYPYIGEVTVAVGLYSASGDRLVLNGDDLGQRAYRASTLNLEPQAESSFLLYEEGWHQEEFDPAAQLQWRWTSDEASLSFRNPRSDAVLYLQVAGRPEGADEPQSVVIRSGDQVLHELELEDAERHFVELSLRAADLGDGDTAKLTVHVEPTFVPAEVDAGANDDRRLGVRVFYAFLEPR